MHPPSTCKLDIATPCKTAWTDMRGNDRARFCGACRMNVYNIEALTAAEVKDLIRQTEGRFCARLFRRSNGTILTRDCPLGLRVRRWTQARTAAIAASAIGLAALLGRLCWRDRAAEPSEATVLSTLPHEQPAVSASVALENPDPPDDMEPIPNDWNHTPSEHLIGRIASPPTFTPSLTPKKRPSNEAPAN